jgi:hypothetical protein
VREGACIGAATTLQPWTLRLILNAAALAAASPTLLGLAGRGQKKSVTETRYGFGFEVPVPISGFRDFFFGGAKC